MDKKRFLIVTALVVVILLLAAYGSDSGATTLEVEDAIFVPDGYTLVGVSAYGRFANNVTFYCQNNESGHVYTCNDGKIGEEIVLPEGYSFAGVSAYGVFANNITFYCRLNGTNRVFVCNPQ